MEVNEQKNNQMVVMDDGNKVVPASRVSEALLVLLAVADPGTKIDGAMDCIVLEGILQSLSQQKQEEEDNAFLPLLALILGKSKASLSSNSIKLLIHLIRNSKSVLQARILNLLATTQALREDEFQDVQDDLLALARAINAGEEWKVKAAAMRFYSAILFPHCSKALLTRRVDFVYPVLEAFPAGGEYQLQQLQYLVALSGTRAFSLCARESLSEDYLARLCFKSSFESVDAALFLRFLLNLASIAPSNISLKDSKYASKVKSLLKSSPSSGLGFLVFVQVFGAEMANDQYAGSLAQVVGQALQFIETESRTGANKSFVLRAPFACLLAMLKTKTVDKIPSFYALFMEERGDLLARVLHEAMVAEDAALCRIVFGICSILGYQASKREQIFACLQDAGVIDLLEKASLAEVGEGGLVDSAQRKEILSWRAPDIGGSVVALQQVTQCDATLCKTLLQGMELSSAITAFFTQKAMRPGSNNAEILGMLIASLGNEAGNAKRAKLQV